MRDFTALFFGIVKSIASDWTGWNMWSLQVMSRYIVVIKISQFGSYKQFSRYPLQTRRIGRFLGSHISEVYMRTTQLQQTCLETLRPRHLWQFYYQLVDRYEHPVHKDLDTNVQWYLTPRALKTQGTKAAKGYTKMRFCKDQRRETRTSEKNPTFSGLYFFHWTFTVNVFINQR